MIYNTIFNINFAISLKISYNGLLHSPLKNAYK